VEVAISSQPFRSSSYCCFVVGGGGGIEFGFNWNEREGFGDGWMGWGGCCMVVS